jgi:hypothetical protein
MSNTNSPFDDRERGGVRSSLGSIGGLFNSHRIFQGEDQSGPETPPDHQAIDTAVPFSSNRMNHNESALSFPNSDYSPKAGTDDYTDTSYTRRNEKHARVSMTRMSLSLQPYQHSSDDEECYDLGMHGDIQSGSEYSYIDQTITPSPRRASRSYAPSPMEGGQVSTDIRSDSSPAPIFRDIDRGPSPKSRQQRRRSSLLLSNNPPNPNPNPPSNQMAARRVSGQAVLPSQIRNAQQKDPKSWRRSHSPSPSPNPSPNPSPSTSPSPAPSPSPYQANSSSSSSGDPAVLQPLPTMSAIAKSNSPRRSSMKSPVRFADEQQQVQVHVNHVLLGSEEAYPPTPPLPQARFDEAMIKINQPLFDNDHDGYDDEDDDEQEEEDDDDDEGFRMPYEMVAISPRNQSPMREQHPLDYEIDPMYCAREPEIRQDKRNVWEMRFSLGARSMEDIPIPPHDMREVAAGVQREPQEAAALRRLSHSLYQKVGGI